MQKIKLYQNEKCYLFRDIEEDIWSRIDGERVKGVIHDLYSLYDVEYEELQSDVMKFLSELENAGLIRYV